MAIDQWTIVNQTYKPVRVTNRVGMVRTTQVRTYHPHAMVTFFLASTCNHNNVASDPMGVILGPRSQPMTLA